MNTSSRNILLFSFLYFFTVLTLFLPSIWTGHVARMEEGRTAFKSLTVTPAGKRSLGRPGCRWGDNIRIDLKKIGINTRN